MTQFSCPTHMKFPVPDLSVPPLAFTMLIQAARSAGAVAVEPSTAAQEFPRLQHAPMLALASERPTGAAKFDGLVIAQARMSQAHS